MVKKTSFLFAFLILGFLAASVFAGFVGNATVQVLDSKLRAIEGAQVSVIYRLNDDNPAFKTNPKLTNQSGQANIKFTNTEYNVPASAYKFRISATYLNVTNEITANLNISKPVYTITLPIHMLEIIMTDNHNVPAYGMVTINGKKVITSENGVARFYLATGNYNVKAEYLGSSRTINIDMKDDLTRVIAFRVFMPTINVVNDQKKPLSAKVTLGNYTAQTDGDGNAKFPQTAVQETNATIIFGDLSVVKPVTFDETDTAKVTIDLNAPKISNVIATYSKGYVILSAMIIDEGEFATGFGNNSEFIVNYTIGPNKRRTYMYPISANKFQAEIPINDPKLTIYYTLSTGDMAGNKNFVSGEFTPEGNPQKPISGNNTGTGTTLPTADNSQTWLYVGAGIIVIAIVGYIIKKKKEEE